MIIRFNKIARAIPKSIDSIIDRPLEPRLVVQTFSQADTYDMQPADFLCCGGADVSLDLCSLVVALGLSTR